MFRTDKISNMASSGPPSIPLKWNTTFTGSSPIWPSEPAISDIISVASEVLYQHLRGEDPSAIRVNFFAQGTFNKTYEAIIPNQEHRYLFRVTLPVDPFWKTESEVATLAFLRQKTTIPVPQVVAWSSTARNTIGYEWILLKKVKGVPLKRECRAMPMDAKIRISERLAAYALELCALAFDNIGSLYFEDTITRTVETNNDSQDSQQIKLMSDFLEKGVEIGKMVLPFFFWKRRLYIPSDRGPFDSSHQFFTAKVQLQAACIKSGVEIAESEDASDIDLDCDEDLVEEALETLDVLIDSLCWVEQYSSFTHPYS